MVDAEQLHYQPAIEGAVAALQRRYNARQPVVLNTYQCYLRGALDRLLRDMHAARQQARCLFTG
jgi:hypothetical protein